MDYVFGPKVLNNLSKCIEYVNERNVCMCVYVMLRYTIKYVEEIFSCLVIPPGLQDITSFFFFRPSPPQDITSLTRD